MPKFRVRVWAWERERVEGLRALAIAAGARGYSDHGGRVGLRDREEIWVWYERKGEE
jgi:hypothetical protein